MVQVNTNIVNSAIVHFLHATNYMWQPISNPRVQNTCLRFDRSNFFFINICFGNINQDIQNGYTPLSTLCNIISILLMCTWAGGHNARLWTQAGFDPLNVRLLPTAMQARSVSVWVQGAYAMYSGLCATWVLWRASLKATICRRNIWALSVKNTSAEWLLQVGVRWRICTFSAQWHKLTLFSEKTTPLRIEAA